MTQPDLSRVFSRDEIQQLHSAGFELQPKADAERWHKMASAYRTLELWDKNGFAVSLTMSVNSPSKHAIEGLIYHIEGPLETTWLPTILPIVEKGSGYV